MKIKVISEFYDKFRTSVLYKEGTVLDFEEDRALNLISRKLAVEVKPETPKVEKPEVKKETPKAEVETEKSEEKAAAPKEEKKPAEKKVKKND